MDKNKILLSGVILIALLGIAAVVLWAMNSRKTGNEAIPPPPSQEQPAANQTGGGSAGDDGFLRDIQQKAEEMKKNYDSSLTEFAEKRWEKLFQERNGLNVDAVANNLKIGSQEVSQEENGSTVYNIKYRYGESENADFFYLLLSDAKLNELGLADLKPNRFLSEEEIRKHLSQPNFANITKVNK